MTIDLSDDEAHVFYNIFCCKRTDFSFKYLGDPLHHTKLRKEDDHQKGGWLEWKTSLLWGKACLA